MHVLNLPLRQLLRTAALAAALTLLVVAAVLAVAPLQTGGGSDAPEPSARLQGVPSWVTDPLAPPALLSGRR